MIDINHKQADRQTKTTATTVFRLQKFIKKSTISNPCQPIYAGKIENLLFRQLSFGNILMGDNKLKFPVFKPG
jgi:hypothetical protein